MTADINKEEESTFKKYQREIERDLELDRIMLEDKQLKLPGIKGKWIGRLMAHKKEIDKLWELYNKAIKNISGTITKESPVKISKKVAVDGAKDHDLIIKIKKEIKEEERLVEYLEKMEKVFSTMSYDISNLVTLIKLETT